VGLALLIASSALAAPIKDKARRLKSSRTNISDNSQLIDVNQIAMFVTNTGSFAFDQQNGASGLEYPKNTAKTAVFAAGLWLGGKIGPQVRIALSEYSDEFRPGPAPGGVPANPDDPAFHVFKLNRVYTDTAERDAALAEYELNAEPWGAPDIDLQLDGSLNVPGDQMMWSVYNDFDSAKHNNDAGHTLPLGVEVQQTTFAFDRLGALGSTVFIKYKIINRGATPITEMYVSQWSDPDLGGAADDLVGCDTTLSLGFVYNANNNDEQYLGQPPAVGYDFLQGPTVGPTVLGLASFNKYINGTDPDDSLKTYNYMLGLDASGGTVINPSNGQPTRYQVSGDPVSGAGWLDTNPADRRLMLSSGPFTMAPGASQEVVVGIVVAQSSNRLASIALMKFYDSFVQAAYDANFDLPNPPNPPVVTATPRAGSVFLSWENSSETYDEPPYGWEGYNVYQGASVAGPWTRLATFDLANGITTLTDLDYNEEQGLTLPIGKAFGQDVGVKYQIEIDEDKVRGTPLYDAMRYYFAVTAYATAPGEFPQVLESSLRPISIVPQTPPAGVDLSTAQISTVAQDQRTTGPAATTDVVGATIVDPNEVVTADWEVGYKNPSGLPLWYLVRRMGTAVDTVLNNMTNVSGDEGFPIVNGVQVNLLSYPSGELARVSYSNVGPNPAAIIGAQVDLRFFGGGADYADLLFGSSVDPFTSGPNVEIRFTGGAVGQKAYRYWRCNCAPRNYNIQGFTNVPWTVWDVDNDIQLNAGWLENEPGAYADSLWDPPADGVGGRELIWVMTTPYTGNTSPEYFGDPDPDWIDALSGVQDFRYVLWPDRVSDGAPIDAGDKILFTTSIPASSNDFYTFSTTAPDRSNTALAKSELERILAVPNPYFGASAYETTQFSRQLKFTHLPAQCTIRVFNLAGDRVRTLEKNDNSSQAVWDLKSDNGLPISSGVYLFHVDAPGIGTHIGKVAVFMERERLNNF
jgi:hypothetical protein